MSFAAHVNPKAMVMNGNLGGGVSTLMDVASADDHQVVSEVNEATKVAEGQGEEPNKKQKTT